MATTSDSFSSILELSESLRSRRASPVRLAATHLERIGNLQPRLNAFITVATESATQAARSAEAEIEHGDWRGPLHGVPIAVKDFYDTAGIRTTAAFAPFERRVPTRDAAAVVKLKEAGAIMVEQPPDDDILWLSHAGVTTARVEDVALVLEVLAERNRDCRPTSFVDSLNRDEDLRIGVADNLGADREVLEVFGKAVETIRSLGYRTSCA